MSEQDERPQAPFDPNQAMTESVSHELHLWIEGLTEDELNKLSMVIHAATHFPMWGAQMLGIMQGERRRRFGACVVCGENHEKQHEDLVASTPVPGTPIPGSPFKVGDAEAFSDQMQKNLVGMNYPDFLRKCVEFNVMPHGDQADPVFCKGCNMRYINLEDRMIKSVDDCDGCHRKASTGQMFPPPDKQ